MQKKDTRKRSRITFDKRLTDRVRAKMQREGINNDLFNLFLGQKNHWLEHFFSGRMNTISRANRDKVMQFLRTM